MTKLESLQAYVTSEEKRYVVSNLKGKTLSNYIRAKLGLPPLKRGRRKKSARTE